MNYTWNPIVKVGEKRIFGEVDLPLFNLDLRHEWPDLNFLLSETPVAAEVRHAIKRNDPKEWERLASGISNPFAYLDFARAIEAERSTSQPQTDS